MPVSPVTALDKIPVQFIKSGQGRLQSQLQVKKTMHRISRVLRIMKGEVSRPTDVSR